MKKLLIIGNVWPEPRSSAAGRRMMQLIKMFQKADYSVDFACTSNTTGFEESLHQHQVKSHNIQLNNSDFERFIHEISPDVVMYDRFMVEEQFGWRVRNELPDALTILDTEDLHFLRKGREEGVKKRGYFQEDDYFNETTKRELASVLRTDLTLVISTFEMQLLISKFHISPGKLFYLPIQAERQQHILSFEERQDVVFIGNFMHQPNWDAVLQLKKIWKDWTDKPKEIHLKVYGAYPPQKAYQLNSEREQFHIMGRAESAQEVIGNARLLIAPLRFGAGLKGKLIEAMALGTPSVTTSIGAEGLGVADGWGGVVEDEVAKWPSVIKDLFESKEVWTSAQEKGFEVLKNLNDSDSFDCFLPLVEQMRTHLRAHRQENFIGEILHHQTLRSTEFMSRWIEEKNKKAPTH